MLGMQATRQIILKQYVMDKGNTFINIECDNSDKYDVIDIVHK